jgi:hypothetical protein
MTNQLQLIPAEADWKLDERTKEIGRRGRARARAALRATGGIGSDPPAEAEPHEGLAGRPATAA